MEYVRLGHSGLRVSRICLGMMSYGDPSWNGWVLDESRAEPIVRAAVEAGVTFFDTADAYSNGASEELTGRMLRRLFAKRDDYVLATKVGLKMGQGPNDRGLSRKHVLAAIDHSLRRLGTDYVDLYQLHRWDEATPIEETLTTLEDAVRAGKVRYVGASSMFAWQFAKALHLASNTSCSRFISMQNHYNLLYRDEEREMNPLCIDNGVGLLPWSPLARGLLAHRSPERPTERGERDQHAPKLYQGLDLSPVDSLHEVAKRYGVPMAQVALAWLLHKPGVVAPVVGATQVQHILDATSALELRLTTDDLAHLEGRYLAQPIRGHA